MRAATGPFGGRVHASIELVVVLAVMGLVLAVVLPNLGPNTEIVEAARGGQRAARAAARDP